MKKKNIIIIIGGVLAIMIAIVMIWQGTKYLFLNQQETEGNTLVDKYDRNTIETIKNNMNVTGNTDIYQIYEEYDGRQILQVKPEIQYEIMFAGILKKGKPEENEIQSLLENKPTKNGIWIAETAREKFLEILKENGIQGYTIEEDGYLVENQQEDKDEVKKINTAILSDTLYVIDMSGTSYIRDEFSGEIVEYPFEKMDPNQIIDVYQNGNSFILEVTTNQRKQVTSQEILNNILLNM